MKTPECYRRVKDRGALLSVRNSFQAKFQTCDIKLNMYINVKLQFYSHSLHSLITYDLSVHKPSYGSHHCIYNYHLNLAL